MKLIVKLEEYFVVIFLAALIMLVFIAAVLRWFGIGVAWSMDMAQLLFAWVCFIGADLALRQNKHASCPFTKISTGAAAALSSSTIAS